MSGVQVIIKDFSKHPHCPHGPTVLFSRVIKGSNKNFYSCAACRDRKDCSFFQWEDDKTTLSNISCTKREYINHKKLYSIFKKIQQLPSNERTYCNVCNCFVLPTSKHDHLKHDLINIDDKVLTKPSELLSPLANSKKEAQFLFCENSIKVIINILREQKFSNVLCIGAPRIHEFILNNCDDMRSLLLDIDRRYLNFYKPSQFCLYNIFNNHFFVPDSKQIFIDFLQSNKGENLTLITDPPFGGRAELLAHTVKSIGDTYRLLNSTEKDLPVFWIFPYFMESHIQNSLPEFVMLDYKVEYDNHTLFTNGTKGRKYGSPIRIFTNVNRCSVTLPKHEGYKYCNICKRWVSPENVHCRYCKDCTSKDGRTYIHCQLCKRCVKPSWTHCGTCSRCTQPDHKCGKLAFEQECFHCKKQGHKKRECPDASANANRKKIKTKTKPFLQ